MRNYKVIYQIAILVDVNIIQKITRTIWYTNYAKINSKLEIVG